ncbi:WD repeat-containing protein 44-like [Canna indica]|uniref:WD repeat-containing protein 44-like n=1 Tax=Canna indica TaxID=4628 RepID=A0AAQ3QF89_9LILI|nr:WD repeat-containing protein 44-like [Canna indica]
MTTTGCNSPEEEFYESLDRILSSCSTSASASASDDESSTLGHRRRAGRLRLPPLRSLDVWFSEPASVEERRRRLLRHLGLAGDPALSRPRRPDACGAPVLSRDPGLGRSAPSAGFLPNPVSSAGVDRSRFDGSAVPGSGNKTLFRHHQVPTKPPLDARFGALDLSDAHRRVDREGARDDPRCLIRNLDNGREFVVKDFRDDGMWSRLREVGTGRQLTMEEFDMCIGKSPIVQELMRRQNVEDSTISSGGDLGGPGGGTIASCRSAAGWKWKKRGSWLKSIKNVAGTMVARGHNCDQRGMDEKDSSSEKGGRRSSSATDDSLDGSNGTHHVPQRIKVRQYGKSEKELSGLCITQEIQAHNGSIWSIKFSLDGQYLASAGEDCIVRVWEVLEVDSSGDLLNEKAVQEKHSRNPLVVAISNGSPEPTLSLASAEKNHWDKKRRPKFPGSRKFVRSDPLVVPEHVFSLSEKPVCAFRGHLGDVLDLSWSKSQYLLSSSMDKTVRLWHMSNNSCLKVFSHSDYVTCIQFNPVDDRYFISGSLDEKVRIWSIPDRQVVDWTDLHEMVTAACYTPDGQAALVGSHRGNCHLYDTSENKLIQKSQVDLQNRKKSKHKKITGFQFAPGNPSKVLVTSADSRIRVIDGDELVHKFKGFRNTSSQISACLTTKGNHVICASEDSHVYVWRYDDSQTNRGKGDATTTQSYEHFHCKGVTVAVTWPNTSMQKIVKTCPNSQEPLDGESQANIPSAIETNRTIDSNQQSVICNSNLNWFNDKVSATWPEELMTPNKQSPKFNGDLCKEEIAAQSGPAWGLVIVTAGQGGEIRTFQNFGLPVQL